MRKEFDTIIIGGGAAGIMSAISSKRNHPNQSVLIIDKTFAIGRKILVSGAGRCNITNINLQNGWKNHYYCDSEDLLNNTFSQFDFGKILEFFHELGIQTYVETKSKVGKIFPITNSAKNVVAILEEELRLLKVDIQLNTQVSDIRKSKDEFIITDLNGELYYCKKLIVSTGGMTYPALGSDGSIYKLLENFGHKVIKMIPTALPLVSKNPLSHELQGVKLELEATSFVNGQKSKSSIDDVMFTQYGLSGPAIMNISRDISIQLNRLNNNSSCSVSLNFFPGKKFEEAYEMMEKIWEKRPETLLERSFYGQWPMKISSAVIKFCNFDPGMKVSLISSEDRRKLMRQLCEIKLPIIGTRGWNEAEFTSGGIDVKFVDNKTLESNLVGNLYFAGEVLDVDGDIGGYNLSWAWASGWVAGKN